jgi:plasmid stability protein
MTLMPVQITIRNVPEGVRNELAARAALERKSMQEYLLDQLERLARKPTVEAWLEKVRERKAASKKELTTEVILRHRDADRR